MYKLGSAAILAATVAFGLSLPVASAQAGWTGDQVNATYYFPDLSTPYENDGTNAAPWSGVSFGEVGWSIGATQITITNPGSIDTAFTSASFNGLVFTDTSGSPDITNVVLDGSSNLEGTPTWTSNSVSLNFEGLPFVPGSIATFDITFGAAVPEPTSLALIGVGIAGIGLLRRRKSR